MNSINPPDKKTIAQVKEAGPDYGWLVVQAHEGVGVGLLIHKDKVVEMLPKLIAAHHAGELRGLRRALLLAEQQVALIEYDITQAEKAVAKADEEPTK